MRWAMASGPLLLALLLVGCSGRVGAAAQRYTPADRSVAAGTERIWRFDADAPGAVPVGGQAVSGSWAVRAEGDAPSPPNALCQTANARWPVLLLGDDVYADLD